MSERFKELVLKTSDPARGRGFESHPLRHSGTQMGTSLAADSTPFEAATTRSRVFSIPRPGFADSGRTRSHASGRGPLLTALSIAGGGEKPEVVRREHRHLHRLLIQPVCREAEPAALLAPTRRMRRARHLRQQCLLQRPLRNLFARLRHCSEASTSKSGKLRSKK